MSAGRERPPKQEARGPRNRTNSDGNTSDQGRTRDTDARETGWGMVVERAGTSKNLSRDALRLLVVASRCADGVTRQFFAAQETIARKMDDGEGWWARKPKQGLPGRPDTDRVRRGYRELIAGDLMRDAGYHLWYEASLTHPPRTRQYLVAPFPEAGLTTCSDQGPVPGPKQVDPGMETGRSEPSEHFSRARGSAQSDLQV
jgi:hypothetical protein